MSLIAFRHVSLLVADLDRARAFYEGILDLKINPGRPDMTFSGVWYDIGDMQIHLMCLPNPEAGLIRPEHGGRDRHIAFSVSDMDELETRLSQTNISFSVSRSGRKALFCRDPDHNALEFISD